MAGMKPLPKSLTDERLDEALCKRYYAAGGFQGVTALHLKLRAWSDNQEVGRYMRNERHIYADDCRAVVSGPTGS